MKFRTWSALVLCLLLVGVLPADAQNSVTGAGDFRNATWGQTQREVQQIEGQAPFYRDDHLVIYRATYADMPADVIYYFVADRLVMGFINLLRDHDDLDRYFEDYEAIKSTLGEKIGLPDVENWQLSLPELEDDRSLWGDALGFGLIQVEAGWLLSDSGVALRLSGGNLMGHLMMVQFSREDMNAGRLAFKQYFGREIGVPNEYFRN